MGFAQCTNNRGEVIGISDLSGDLTFHAFLWREGVMKDLGTLGGDNSEAIWINDAGDIAGSADLPGANLHDAVIWRHGRIQDLGTIGDDSCSRGRGINSRGQVVGGSSDCRNFLRAFVWEEGGPMRDLNKLIAPGSGVQITNAFNINDRGEILAKSIPEGVTPIDDLDQGHLVLLIPCEKDDRHKGCESDDRVVELDANGHAATSENSQGDGGSVAGADGRAVPHSGGEEGLEQADREECRSGVLLWTDLIRCKNRSVDVSRSGERSCLISRQTLAL